MFSVKSFDIFSSSFFENFLGDDDFFGCKSMFVSTLSPSSYASGFFYAGPRPALRAFHLTDDHKKTPTQIATTADAPNPINSTIIAMFSIILYPSMFTPQIHTFTVFQRRLNKPRRSWPTRFFFQKPAAFVARVNHLTTLVFCTHTAAHIVGYWHLTIPVTSAVSSFTVQGQLQCPRRARAHTYLYICFSN